MVLPYATKLFPFAALIVFTAIGCAASADCNQSCPVAGLNTRVMYPFGFSEGCPIQLNCTDSRGLMIGEFEVKSITKDGIWINIPATCNRSIESLRQLYGNNYAPSLQNVFVIVNCSYLYAPLHSCGIGTSKIEGMLRSQSCMGYTSDAVRCISDGYKGVSDLLDRNDTDDCSLLLSSFTLEQSRRTTEVLKLMWWLEGNCRCSPNADCFFYSLPNGKMGYQCYCRKGFKGDGYHLGLGCQEDKNGTRIIVISTGVVTVVLGLSLALYIWRKKGKCRRKKLKLHGNVSQKEDTALPFFDLATISNATNSFSADNKLGAGGFGPVYKGILQDGQEIAVKRLSKSSSQGLEEFKNEVTFIAKLQHRNLVKLLGYCHEGEEKMLIYEYLPNKSLDCFIFDPKRSRALDWQKRVDIINGIVRGLIYLHQDSRLRIIHRDLKASNILLDKDLNPKISDFGTARSFRGNETEANTNRVVGTYGYMPPEYVFQGLYSIKSDVFSFGVLVLEIVTGKRNTGFSCYPSLPGHAWKLYTEGMCLELVDASMGNSFNPSEAQRLVHVALLCVQQSPDDRPGMLTVALMLGGDGKLPKPKQPGFCNDRILRGANSSSSNHEQFSVNELTLSPLTPR